MLVFKQVISPMRPYNYPSSKGNFHLLSQSTLLISHSGFIVFFCLFFFWGGGDRGKLRVRLGLRKSDGLALLELFSYVFSMSDLQERAGKIDDSVAINCTEFGLPAR